MDLKSLPYARHSPIRTPPSPASPRLVPATAREKRSPCPPDQSQASIFPLKLSANFSTANNYTHSSPSETSTRSPSVHSGFSPSTPDVQEESSDDLHATESRRRAYVVANSCVRTQVINVKALFDSPTSTNIKHPGSPGTAIAEPCLHGKTRLSLPIRTHAAGASNNPTNSRASDKGGRSTNTPSDRGRNQRADDDENNTERRGGGGRQGGGNGEQGDTSSRRVQPVPDRPMSCPYRKRNKLRFNYDDHPACTKPFKTLSAVKTHVREYHQSKYMWECRRCWQHFESEVDLKQHENPPRPGRICEATAPPQREIDPEDGITADIHNKLRERKGHSKAYTWELVWQALFPDDSDDEIPSPDHEYCIGVELYESENAVEKAVEQATANLNRHVATNPNISASQLVAQMSSEIRECITHNFQELAHTKLSTRSTAPRPRRKRETKASRRETKASRRRNQDNRDLPAQAHRQQQPLPPLLPAPGTSATTHGVSSSPPMATYHPSSLPFQSHGYVGPAANEPLSGFESLDRQVWTSFTTPAATTIANPAQIQHGSHLEDVTSLFESTQAWSPNDPRAIFHVSSTQQPTGAHPVPQSTPAGMYPTPQQGSPPFPAGSHAPSQAHPQGSPEYEPHSARYYHTSHDGYGR